MYRLLPLLWADSDGPHTLHSTAPLPPCLAIHVHSVDLVQCAGFEGDACCLNEDLVAAVQVLAAATQKWGIMPTLDFVRGGRTGGGAHWSMSNDTWHKHHAVSTQRSLLCVAVIAQFSCAYQKCTGACLLPASSCHNKSNEILDMANGLCHFNQ